MYFAMYYKLLIPMALIMFITFELADNYMCNLP